MPGLLRRVGRQELERRELARRERLQNAVFAGSLSLLARSQIPNIEIRANGESHERYDRLGHIDTSAIVGNKRLETRDSRSCPKATSTPIVRCVPTKDEGTERSAYALLLTYL
jgi:hypothetical protein